VVDDEWAALGRGPYVVVGYVFVVSDGYSWCG
jgi:hypothetical protein